MDAKNYAQVLIDGKIYTLTGSEDEAYLQKTASYVNEKLTAMRKIPGFSKQSGDYQIAMLGLNLADDYFKADEAARKAAGERDAMEKETYSLKHELVGTQMKLEAVLADLEERQKQLEQLQKKVSALEAEAKKQQAAYEKAEDEKAEAADDLAQAAEAQSEHTETKEELVRRALQAAEKASGHKGGRR